MMKEAEIDALVIPWVNAQGGSSLVSVQDDNHSSEQWHG